MSEDETRNLNAMFNEVVTLLRPLSNRLEKLENSHVDLAAKVEARLYDTRPIWEQVLSRLTEIEHSQQDIKQRQERMEQRQERMEQRQERMEQRQESMDRRIRWLYDEFKELKVKLKPLYGDVVKLLNDRDDFEERILKLETEHS
jgi:chromosome segregation ATPase